MNVKEQFKNITDVIYVTIGVLIVVILGLIMIKKNRLYYCDTYCEDNNVYIITIVLSLHDEEEIDYSNFSDYTFDGSLYDVVDVLDQNKIRTVLTTELVEIGEKNEI